PCGADNDHCCSTGHEYACGGDAENGIHPAECNAGSRKLYNASCPVQCKTEGGFIFNIDHDTDQHIDDTGLSVSDRNIIYGIKNLYGPLMTIEINLKDGYLFSCKCSLILTSPVEAVMSTASPSFNKGSPLKL